MGRQKWILYSTGDSRYTSGKIYDALSLNASRKTLKLPGHSPITCDIRRFCVNPKADEQGFLLLVDVDGQKELLIAVPACTRSRFLTMLVLSSRHPRTYPLLASSA